MFIDEEILIFDKENCDDCLQEVLGWDEQHHYDEVNKLYPEKKRKPKDPRKEKLRQWRQCDRWRRAPEPKHERKPWQKKFRNKMKQNIDKEEYYRPSIHEYRTYGWLYW